MYIHAKKAITIGNNCAIAGGIVMHITLAGCLDRTKEKDNPKEIIIGNNVWIGENAIILKGTINGDNSVVSAGCVVKGVFDDNPVIKMPPLEVTKVKINYININIE